MAREEERHQMVERQSVARGISAPLVLAAMRKVPREAFLPADQVELDSDRDRWFTAEQAQEYGFIDHVITGVTPVPVGN